MTFGRPINVRPLVPADAPTIGPRNAMAGVLAEYLRCAEFRVYGAEGGDTTFRLAEILPEWPDADRELVYPSASVIELTDTFHEAHALVPTPLEETLGMYDGQCNGPENPRTVLWKHAEATAEFQLDFWTSNLPDREAIEAELSHLFAPQQERYGVVLGGHPRYYDIPVRATLVSHRRVDNEGTVYANERRLRCVVRCEVDAVRLYVAALMSPGVKVFAEDPTPEGD